jgi:hypothetical protein
LSSMQRALGYSLSEDGEPLIGLLLCVIVHGL